MIRVQQIRMPIDHHDEDLEKKLLKILKINQNDLINYQIFRKSIDARKGEIYFVYTIDAVVKGETLLLKKNKNIQRTTPYHYGSNVSGTKELKYPPVIVGSGPAGLFCSLLLAEQGYRPILLERGKDIQERAKDVTIFWEKGELNEESNVQYGEGGAGTFSDGKLNTLVKDKNKRGRKVLESFVEAGAPNEILYLNKPHIGTDVLKNVIKNLRDKITGLGGEVHFQSKVTGLQTDGKQLLGVEVNHQDYLEAEQVVFAIGHSARDTFKMLYDSKIQMQPKPFAIGVRIEHPQVIINEVQYGKYANHPALGAADYKLKYHCSNGRAAYTFCMCPGGKVINAASEKGRLVTNGMSYHARDGKNANSALLISVGPEDFPKSHPLSGIDFQRYWEEKAWNLGGQNYHAPLQLVGDFLNDQRSKEVGAVLPTITPGYEFADLRECLPQPVIESMKEAIQAFEQKIPGFAKKDVLLTGIETRSSSPVRMIRDENFQSSIEGLYPAGEGAGYAGGIMSAAMDGIKVAESIMRQFKPG